MPMKNEKIFNVGKYKIKLILPDVSKDLKYSSGNNIDTYDENDLFLWNIAELLKAYSKENGLEYYDEMYFDIKIIDDGNILCVGFNNHCEINLKTAKIVKLINNR